MDCRQNNCIKSSAGTVTTYEEYLEYLVSHTEKLEESSIDNLGRNVNMVETNFMDSYIPDNTYYGEGTDLATYLGEREVDMNHSTLEHYQML